MIEFRLSTIWNGFKIAVFLRESGSNNWNAFNPMRGYNSNSKPMLHLYSVPVECLNNTDSNTCEASELSCRKIFPRVWPTLRGIKNYRPDYLEHLGYCIDVQSLS